MDAEGRIVYADETARRWLHCQQEQAFTLLFSVLPVRAKTPWQQVWQLLQTSGSCTLEMESPANGTAMATARWTLDYVRLMEREYAIGFPRDIAGHHLAEPACRANNRIFP